MTRIDRLCLACGAPYAMIPLYVAWDIGSGLCDGCFSAWQRRGEVRQLGMKETA